MQRTVENPLLHAGRRIGTTGRITQTEIAPLRARRDFFLSSSFFSVGAWFVHQISDRAGRRPPVLPTTRKRQHGPFGKKRTNHTLGQDWRFRVALVFFHCQSKSKAKNKKDGLRRRIRDEVARRKRHFPGAGRSTCGHTPPQMPRLLHAPRYSLSGRGRGRLLGLAPGGRDRVCSLVPGRHPT